MAHRRKKYNMMLENYQMRLKNRNIKVEYHSNKKSIDAFVADISKTGKLFLLDERGEQYTSTEFASLVGDWSISDQDVNLAIGPVDGWQKFSTITEDHISLSKFTLPHELAAVMLASKSIEPPR